MISSHPSQARSVVVGGGTMGMDVAIVLARGGSQVTVVEPDAVKRQALAAHVRHNLEPLGMAHRTERVQAVADLADVASPEDVDAAVRFGFGFRFLAAGPVMQRDHAGLEVHTAAAASMYPSLAVNAEPARVLQERVSRGDLGMKTGQGFFSWTPETQKAERERYDRLLRQGLDLLASELPPLHPLD